MSHPVPSRDGASAALAWLGHPLTVLALVVLVVNDHVLKAAFPGPVTGKLSDVAGLVLAPPLVAALLTLAAPRLPVRIAVVAGLVLVGAGFTFVKSSGYVAAAASAAWSAVAGPSLVRADRTDLFTLPALALAWWSWSRSRRRPVRERAARVVRLVVLLPAAVLAVAATSAVHYPYAVGTTTVAGHPAISMGSGTGNQWPERPSGWLVSDDGAATWREPSVAEWQHLYGQAEGPRRQACAADGHCYRVVPGHLRVEESDDAGETWRTAWEISDSEREPLARRHPDPGDVRRHFSSRELAVFPAADGRYGVLVANGRDGFLLRHPDGRWERKGFFKRDGFDGPVQDEPLALGQSSPAERESDVLLAVALALCLGFGVLAVAAQLAVRRAGGSPAWGWSALLASLPAWALLALAWQRFEELTLMGILVLVVLPLGALIPFVLLVVAWYRGATGWWTGEAFGAFLVTVLLAAGPLTGWMYGVPARTWAAVLLALAATLPGLWLARRASRLVVPRAARFQVPPYPLVPPPPSRHPLG